MFHAVRNWANGLGLGTPLILVLALFLIGAVYYPPGIGDGLRGPAFAIGRGVYPAADEGGCCWIGDSALLRLNAPANAASMIVTIFVPDFQPFRNAAEALNVGVDGLPLQRICCFARGLHQFAVALPSRRPSVIDVTIVPSIWFVPAKIGIGGDTRRLSVLLRGIDYRDPTGTPIERNSIAGDVSATSPLALIPYGALLLIAFLLARRRAVFGLG